MENLKAAKKEELQKRYNVKVDNIKDLKNMVRYATDTRIKQYDNEKISKDDFIKYTTNRVKKAHDKKVKEATDKIEKISQSGTFQKATINTEWTPSTMGKQAQSSVVYEYTDEEGNNRSYRVEGVKTDGLGYDKETAAISDALNKIPSLLKELYKLKNENVNIKNHDLFGYGSGYGDVPYFEGGVGKNVYYKIFDTIGLKFTSVSRGKNFDVYSIERR